MPLILAGTIGSNAIAACPPSLSMVELHLQLEFAIRYNLTIDCYVSQNGFRTELLKRMLKSNFPLRFNKKLRFFVSSCNVPSPYTVKWKVRNIGPVAESKDQIRGQICIDGGNEAKNESTTFMGSHFVECYVIKDEVCVARDRIDVPISN